MLMLMLMAADGRGLTGTPDELTFVLFRVSPATVAYTWFVTEYGAGNSCIQYRKKGRHAGCKAMGRADSRAKRVAQDASSPPDSH